jgi:hypothetical protein
MNAREVLLSFRVIVRFIAPGARLRNFEVKIHFETNRVGIARKFMAPKPAKGAQGE